MNLRDVFKNRDTYTSTASTIVRQLGFAGIAIIWLFRRTVDGADVIPQSLRVPGALIVSALAADLLHYVVGSAAWGLFGWVKDQDEAMELDKPEFRAPRPINWGTNLFFWSKIVLMMVAYAFLLSFMWRATYR